MRLAFMSKCKRSEIKALVGIVELLQKASFTSKKDVVDILRELVIIIQT